MKRITVPTISLAIVSFFTGCEKSEISDFPGSSFNNIESTKDFQIKPEWLTDEYDVNHREEFIDGSIYNGFGQGVDILTNQDKISLYRSGSDLEPFVTTFRDEETNLKYVSSTYYEEIQENVDNELSAFLKIDLRKFKIKGSLDIKNQSKINSRNNSVYISVLYIKKFGQGWIQYNDPNLLTLLQYGSSLDGGNDEINISNITWRSTYGDKFRSMMGFGVMMNATIEITNIDFQSSSRQEVAIAAKLAIKNMVELGGSWDQTKTSDQRFAQSSLIVDGKAIPRTSKFIFNMPDLVSELNYLDQIYSQGDLGVFWSSYEDYNVVYPNTNFINIDEFNARKNEWVEAKSKLQRWLSLIQNTSNSALITEINNEILKCDTNIDKLEKFNSVESPSTYDYILEKIKPSLLKNLSMFSNSNGNYSLNIGSVSGTYLGKIYQQNFEPEILKPMYKFYKNGNYCYGTTVEAGATNISIAFYVYKSQNTSTNPLIRGTANTGSYIYKYSNNVTDIFSTNSTLYPLDRKVVGIINK